MKASSLLVWVLAASTADAQVVLAGGGATFPYPVYQKWFESYSKTKPDVRFTYSPVGSGRGIESLLKGDFDFAGSDIPLDGQENIVQFPSVAGAVVPIYRLNGVAQDLRFTPETLAGIFLGKIVRWNDPALKAVNRGAPLPDRPIAVVHRSDASGTSFAFTDYLSKVSPEWKSRVGSGATVSWPVGLSAEGNEGVAKLVSGTPDSISYVEFVYALEQKLSFGEVRNGSGKFIQADLTSITAAAASAAGSVSITAAPGRNSYPIATFTFLLVPRHPSSEAKGAALAAFLEWMLSAGQRQCSALGYAPLPDALAAEEKSRALELRHNRKEPL